MDIHMPGMDGFETTRQARRLYASHGRLAPPIVALTANAFAEDRKRCLEAGLDDYLAKPFDRSELEALLDKWCAAERVRRDGSLGGVAA
jgi:CheY-like chemotaxis protein